ncbi:Fic family protein [Pseudothauera nasutitermitis]|uniref:Fic family protein n=1 Tax=Pseudothauera nasutitermitis TaxID=2565930 RepID=A0A4S4ASQ7_9RHOO|nr:Fic family protein [Pseudothauera nasutitermitis]THF62903.1 Fic family protein [Pseudothauera nasutitermitis]
MSSITASAELTAIIAAVSRFPEGASIEAITAALPDAPPRRTLQRRLAQLVAEGRLGAQGERRGRRYFPAVHQARMFAYAPAPVPPAHFVGVAEATVVIPLSLAAREVEAAVRQPLGRRQPVGYRRDFLDAYQPNRTRYLPPELCDELRAAGQASVTETPAGTYARQIYDRLLIDLSWNSSRLEGNTYSLLETELLLAAGQTAGGKGALEAQMILNHKSAIEFLVDGAADIDFDRYTLLNLHALLSDNLLADPTACGRPRTIAVGIGGTVFHPLEGPQRIEECLDQVLDTAAAIAEPFEQAFFVMVHLPYLQPFEDVNKRVSRLAANIPLIRHNLCPLSFVDVPQQTYVDATLGIYELNRIELLRDVFAWAYKRSCARYSAVRQSLGEPDPFRLHYRRLLGETVAEVVRARFDKAAAIARIRQRAANDIPEPDRPRFIEIAETELMSLHEGNIARYRLRPGEYRAWREKWR